MIASSVASPGRGGDDPPPLRICVPVHSFEPGGVERVGLRLAERWQAAGHEVTVILGRDRGAARAQAPALDYRTRPEPFSTVEWETPWLIWCLWRHLRHHPTDVIFCAGNTYTIVCVMMKLLLGRRCPPVLVKISNDLLRPDFPAPMQALYRVWVRMQGRYLDHFVALAEPMLPQIVRELGVVPARAQAIPDPALHDDEIAAPPTPRPGDADGRRFLAVSRLAKQKNLPLMLEAFARIARPGDRLDIAGEGSWRAYLERRIGELGLDGRVTLLGHIADVRPLLDAAHALVMSSDYEGVPAVIPEALAAGRPIAATDCCVSMRWLVQDGAFGVLAPGRDAAALGAAMERAARMNPDMAAMHRFSALFTLGKAAPAYLDAMQALVGNAATHVAGPAGSAQDRVAPC
jgi:glycosyltransferase involved in cell wall biosynthesis